MTAYLECGSVKLTPADPTRRMVCMVASTTGERCRPQLDQA